MDMRTSISQRAITDFFVGYCEDRGINVHFDQYLKTAACDNRGNLYLPYPSVVGSEKFWWDAYHEGGHLDPGIRWTMDLFSQFSKDPRKHLVLNILVDYLSEKNRYGYFRGRDRAMYEGRIKQNKEVPDLFISWKDRPLIPALFAIDMDMRETWQGAQYKPAMPVEAEPYYEAMKEMSLMTRLESIADNKDGNDLVALVEELVDLEPKQEKDSEEQQSGGTPSPSAQAGEGEGQAGKSGESDMDSEGKAQKGKGSSDGSGGDSEEESASAGGSEIDDNSNDGKDSADSSDNADSNGSSSNDSPSSAPESGSESGDDSSSSDDSGSGSESDDCNDGAPVESDSKSGGGWGPGGFSEEDKNTVLEQAGLNDNPSKARPELDKHERYSGSFQYLPDMNYMTNDITRNASPLMFERNAIDEINSNSQVHKQIQRYLLTLKASHYQHGKRRGKISSRSLHRMYDKNPMPSAVFKTKDGQAIDTDTAVNLLIDTSGSMNGHNKYITACACALSLCETLRDIRVPFSVYGHTTNGTPGVGVYMHIYKRWDEGNVTRDTMLDRFSTNRKMNWNSDGEAIMYAAEDLMAQGKPKNVLIVLSDGRPCGSGKGNGKWYLREVIKHLGEVPNLTVYGIGIMTGNVREYYDNVCVVDNPADLDASLLPLMRDCVLTSK